MYKTLCAILFSLLLYPAYGQRATDTFKLYFDLNVPTLNNTAEKKIDLLIYNDKIITGSSIMIIGYADYLGTEGHNKELSMKRAKNVRDYLVKYGINAKDVTLCVGQGEVIRTGLTNKDGYPTDRRVDIVTNNKIKKKAQPPVKPRSSAELAVKPKKDTTNKVTITNMNDITHLKPGNVFQLNNVYFPPDRHVIMPESYKILEQLYAVLRDNPDIKISIEGHVCCIKGAPDALDEDTEEPVLSVNRAKEIYSYLVHKGIDASRLEYKGFGRSRPLIVNEVTDEDAAKNRRVEIRIIEN